MPKKFTYPFFNKVLLTTYLLKPAYLEFLRYTTLGLILILLFNFFVSEWPNEHALIPTSPPLKTWQPWKPWKPPSKPSPLTIYSTWTATEWLGRGLIWLSQQWRKAQNKPQVFKELGFKQCLQVSVYTFKFQAQITDRQLALVNIKRLRRGLIWLSQQWGKDQKNLRSSRSSDSSSAYRFVWTF